MNEFYVPSEREHPDYLVNAAKILGGIALTCILVLIALIFLTPAPEPVAYATNSIESIQESTALSVSDTLLTKREIAAIEAEKKAAEEAARAAEEEAARQAAEEEAARLAEEQAELDPGEYDYIDYSDYYWEDGYYYGDDGEWYNTDGLTASSGVNYYNGRKETYYSSNVLYHYRTPEWTAGEDGVYRDADGYVVIAANKNEYSEGTVVDTSFGEGKVYDSGCDYGTTDVYVNW